MTKTRPPLTFELGLTRIAGLIGWDRVAALAGQEERTVRNWSDPDTGPSAEQIPLGTSLRLDAAYRAAGGPDAPMLDCYALRFATELGGCGHDLSELAMRIADAAKEGGEALAAAIRAALPGASDEQLARAILEFQESISAKTDVVEALTAIRERRRIEAAELVA